MSREARRAQLTPLQRAQERLMSDLSEDAYSAGWLVDLEHELWEMIAEGGRFGFGCSCGWRDELEPIVELARQTGVWITFEGPVPLDEFARQHAAWKEHRAVESEKVRAELEAMDNEEPMGELMRGLRDLRRDIEQHWQGHVCDPIVPDWPNGE